MRTTLAVAAVLAVAGCSSTGAASAPTTSPTPTAAVTSFVSGTLTLTQDTGKRGASCAGSGGYEDIHVGTQVIVTDAASKTVALGELDEGARDIGGDCVFPFSLMVPAGDRIYGIEVAHRGRVQFKAEDLEKPVSLTLSD